MDVNFLSATQRKRVWDSVLFMCGFAILRELSFLMLGTGVEEFLEGCHIYLPCLIGLPNVLPIHDGVAIF